MITAILNKYKDTFDDLFDSSDIESLGQQKSSDQSESIDKETSNAYRSGSAWPILSEDDCLDKDVLVMSLGLPPKIPDFQVYKHHYVAPFSPKSRRTQDRED